jgi:nucleoside-diphosphate-sugar epimerase
MAGRKFGTSGGGEELTWAMNTILPANIAEKFSRSSIVVFSTGCVYPLVAKDNSCREDTRPEPEGEYAQSCLGRERIFSYFSKLNGTRILIYRLNYSVDLRYGVLYDIAMKVKNGEPVDIRVPYYNAIWQGDACDYALSSLELCSNPPAVLNVTGPEVASVKTTALKFGKYFGKEVLFNSRQGKISYLNDASKSFTLFGRPSVSLKKLIEWQAKWILAGGRSLGKPTHFEVNNGKY